MPWFGRTPPPPRPVPAPGARWSSGWPSLDVALGGGFEAGHPVLIRGDAAVSIDGFRRLTLPVAGEVLRRAGGVLVVLDPGEPPDRPVREILGAAAVGEGGHRLRVVDFRASEPLGPWHVALGPGLNRDRAVRRMAEADRHLRSGGGPMAELGDWDAHVVATDPEVARRMLASGLPRARELGNLAITWAGPTYGARAPAELFDVELALGYADGRTRVRGLRPVFPATALAAGGA